MNRDVYYYESLLEIMADEINVKKVVIGTGYEELEIVYHHDTIKGGGYSEVVHHGKVIDAPKTRLLVLELFFSGQAEHLRKS